MEQAMFSLMEPLPEDVVRMVQYPEQMMNRFDELITRFSGGVDSHLEGLANSLFNDQPDSPNRTASVKVVRDLEEVEVGTDHDACCICLCGFNCDKDVSEMTLKDMKVILDNHGVCYVKFIEKIEFREAIEAIGFNNTSVAIRLPCEHEFHPTCIKEWLKRDHRCPICRYELSTIDDHMGGDTIVEPGYPEDNSEEPNPDHSGSVTVACPDGIEQDQWDELPYDIQLEIIGFPAV
jgi:hypothetical protein